MSTGGGNGDNVYTAEQLTTRTWKVVENDPYGQYPFMYVVIGFGKCILIDTGCGKNQQISE
jgi:hypothetical protein